MTHTNTIRNIVVLTILVVLMFAIYIFQQKRVTNSPLSTSSPSPSPLSITSPTPRPLTPEEQAVLKIPLHYDPPEQKIQHTQQVAKLATTAPELDITACKPNPIVYQVGLNSSFKIKNNDSIPHTLRYMSSQILISGHGSTTINTSQLFNVSGDYGYGCDNPFAKAGLIVVR